MTPTPEQQEQAATFILFFILVGTLTLAGVGAIVFHVLGRRVARQDDDYVAPEQPGLRPSQIAAEAPSKAKDGRSSDVADRGADDEAWTPEEILRQLAPIKKIGKDGSIAYLSKERLATLVGMRAEEARAIIDEVRGEPPPAPAADPRFPESTRDGRPVASHLKQV